MWGWSMTPNSRSELFEDQVDYEAMVEQYASGEYWKGYEYSPPVLMLSGTGSTVKHLNWVWPGCLKKGMGEWNVSLFYLWCLF